jgi:hypothetical protein
VSDSNENTPPPHLPDVFAGWVASVCNVGDFVEEGIRS